MKCQRASLLVVTAATSLGWGSEAFAPGKAWSTRAKWAESGVVRREGRSQTRMVAVPTAMGGAMIGGAVAGSLHAVTGPDHLAALLPRCCGQRWFRAGKVGALWGMGHGISATLLGLTAFFVKRHVPDVGGFKTMFRGASHLLEIAVGVSLVVIGLVGIIEAREWRDEITNVSQKNLSAAAIDPGIKKTQRRAVVFNGLLHGFSWDGAPSLAPALAIATWKGSFAFLLAYAFGTIAAMTITTTLVGETTRKAGQLFNRPDIPQKLSFVSSWIAIAVGLLWVALALR